MGGPSGCQFGIPPPPLCPTPPLFLPCGGVGDCHLATISQGVWGTVFPGVGQDKGGGGYSFPQAEGFSFLSDWVKRITVALMRTMSHGGGGGGRLPFSKVQDCYPPVGLWEARQADAATVAGHINGSQTCWRLRTHGWLSSVSHFQTPHFLVVINGDVRSGDGVVRCGNWTGWPLAACVYANVCKLTPLSLGLAIRDTKSVRFDIICLEQQHRRGGEGGAGPYVGTPPPCSSRALRGILRNWISWGGG